MHYPAADSTGGGPRRRQTGGAYGRPSIVTEVRDALAMSYEAERENRREAAADLDFLAGIGQWPDWIRRQRQIENRPMLTINRMPQFLRHVTNQIRESDLSIKVSPIGEDDQEQLSEIYNGILRQIHYRSSAKHVYCTASEHQATCGIGWFRIKTAYVDDVASFDQELLVESIMNPLSVYCDPAAVKPDRSDAMWMIVTDLMPTDTFSRTYKDAAPSDVDAPADYDAVIWQTGDVVRRAEYWRKVPVKIVLAQMDDGTVLDITSIPGEQRSFLPIQRTRDAKSYRVERYMVSGADVLEDRADWLGRHIPIVPVIGAEIPLERSVYRHGVIRYAREPQQLYNFYRTASAEWIANAPKAPYLVTPRMLEGVKGVWDSMNLHNRPYLPYNPDPGAPGAAPKREPPPPMPTAMVQEAQIASEDMKATTGIYDAGLGAQGNETSGRAILAREQQGDAANYHYIDNVYRALEHAGRILIELIPKIYDNERAMRLSDEQGNETAVTINQMAYMDTGEPVMLNDLSMGRFDVRVEIGRSYKTRRVETANSMIEFARAVPGAAALIGDMIAKALDFPGAEEIGERMKRTLPPHIVDENVPQQPGPDPLQVAQVEAKVRKDNAAALKILADIDALDAQLGNLGAGQPLPSYDPVNPTLPQEEPQPQMQPEQMAGMPEPMPGEAMPIPEDHPAFNGALPDEAMPF